MALKEFFSGSAQMRKPFQFRLTFIEISPEQTWQKSTFILCTFGHFPKMCQNISTKGKGGFSSWIYHQSKRLGGVHDFWNFLRVCRVKGRKILQIIGEEG